MCVRFTLAVEAAEIISHYDIKPEHFPEGYKKTYNISSSQPVLSIIHDGYSYRAGYVQWGHPSPDKKGKLVINTRSETVMDFTMLRSSFQRRRMVIPADGYLEWIGTNTGKQPMRFVLKSGELFSMAALYETWDTPEGKKSSCVILTTEPNFLVSPVHNRMPVILREDDEAAWLDRSNQDGELLRSFLHPYRADLMRSYPVSRLANDVQYNSPLLIKEIELDGNLF